MFALLQRSVDLQEILLCKLHGKLLFAKQEGGRRSTHLCHRKQFRILGLFCNLDGLSRRSYEMLIWAKTHLTEESAKQLYITRRQSTINECRAKLGRLVDERQAASLVRQIMAQSSTKKQQNTYTKPLE